MTISSAVLTEVEKSKGDSPTSLGEIGGYTTTAGKASKPMLCAGIIQLTHSVIQGVGGKDNFLYIVCRH